MMKKRFLILLAGLLGAVGLIRLKIRAEAVAYAQPHLFVQGDPGPSPSDFGGGGGRPTRKG